MKNIIAIASAKGGVGKSTICCHLAKAFTSQHKKVILIETNAGLRGLDIFLGVKDVVYDLGDVLKQNCSLKEAILNVKYNENLFLLAAPFSFDIMLSGKAMFKLCNSLKELFDIIIIDVRTDPVFSFEIKNIVDIFLIVVTLDAVCVRDTALFSNMLSSKGNCKPTLRLIINKLKKNIKKTSPFKNLDDIIDETNLQLIGVLPFSKDMQYKTQHGKNLNAKSVLYKIFTAISKRIEGKNLDIII